MANIFKLQNSSNQIGATVSDTPSKSIDAWGFCSITHEKWLRLFEPIYQKYFRVNVSGLENVPIRWLARKLGVPYLPVTSPIPFPTKVRLVFGEPMVFKAKHNTEEEVFGYVEEVKAKIDSLVQQGLSKRKGWFL